MKIVYCTPSIFNSGGMERVLSNKANYLVAQGYDVSIIATSNNGKEPFFTFDPRIKIYHLDLHFDTHGLFRQQKIARQKKIILPLIEALLQELKPDITISLFGKHDRFIYECKDGSKKIIERHFSKHKRAQNLSKLESYSLGRMITYLYRRKEYSIVKRFDSFVVLTEEDKEQWGKLPNIMVIPNALTFQPQRFSDCSPKRVVAIGRFSKQKQFNLLVDIWNIVAPKHPDWKLAIYGEGSLKSKVKSQIQQLNLDDSIELYPATSDVETQLINSSIFAFSSLYEGFGLVLTEAMICGLPVVSFACKCGPRDVIDEGINGFLIEPQDINSFAEKLMLLMQDETLRKQMGELARKNVMRFSEENVMKKWTDLFHKLSN